MTINYLIRLFHPYFTFFFFFFFEKRCDAVFSVKTLVKIAPSLILCQIKWDKLIHLTEFHQNESLALTWNVKST